MQWNRRNIIMVAALGTLLPVAIYMNIKNLGGGRPSKSRVIPAPPGAFTPPPPVVGGAAPVAESEREARLFQPIPVNTAKFRQLVASGAWGRDPFLTAGEIRGMTGIEVVETEQRVLAPVELTVSSVLISGQQAVAIINNDIYTVGDFIADTGDVVLGINREGVLLEGPQGQRLIQLKQSKIPLKSVEKK